MKDLLRIADLTEHDLAYLLDRAEHLKRHPGAAGDPLEGQTVLLHFAKPSTRTRVSTETAVVRPGGVPLTVAPAELQLGRGETIADTARVIGSYAAAVVIRTFDHDDVARVRPVRRGPGDQRAHRRPSPAAGARRPADPA
ncbi:hypothetical protein [Nonomuraea rubra]|uniref:Ornithine carbamoyltransferase n=1 Tax=Nonomuraea rubra TaxID=46180 RepID=A0A7X0U361_9ACTN|nr:hypothetical protein [Nonomuraea rubra]MBB6553441.1 ornithine carbamoyltransferase [Nonomuraea rubra]